MEKYFKYTLIFFLFSVLTIVYLIVFYKPQNEVRAVNFKNNIVGQSILKKKDKTVKIKIIKGSTYGNLMEQAKVDEQTIQKIYQVAIKIYDLSQIRLGKTLDLVYDNKTNKLKGLKYQINFDDILIVQKKNNNWLAKKEKIKYTTKIKIAEGVVKSSMYKAAMENNIDERAIIELANAFQWTIDFANDPRVGDTFKFAYEKLYLDGKYIMPGKILVAKYVNAGTPLEIFYFQEDENNKGYFDIDGHSVQKMFLKTPVSFKYISSGYTNGHRYIQQFNMYGRHRAIDYAADYGSPIRSVGDGVVTFAGWSSIGYGNFTKIRHNGTYSTHYAHQSKIIVHVRQRVKQGQIIGYVGSTGNSTGPHLHFEMKKNGILINPLKEVLPPGRSIKKENKDRFLKEIEKYKKMID